MQQARFSFARPSVWLPWVIPVCLVQGLDIATTATNLRLGFYEANPLMASALAHGELLMYGLKVAVVTALILAIIGLRWRYRVIWPFFVAMNVPTALAVAVNVLGTVLVTHQAG